MRRITLLLLALLVGAGESLAAQARPNIVVIVADDMGYADIGPYGVKDIPTPNLDALAASGVRFTDAYVTGPYCSPTRAGLMTGRYPQRFGHEFNIGMAGMHAEAGLPVEEVTLADRLKAAGYRTAIFGKWHLGSAARFRPRSRGFDEFFGFLAGGHSYVAVTQGVNAIMDGDSIPDRIDYLTDAIGGRAVEFINRNKARPFFLYVAFNAVHVPMQATDKYLSRFPSLPEPRRTYAAMLSAMDENIGRTLAALRANGLEENTLVFFFSDNGGPTFVGGVNGSRNDPLRGSKRQTWEGGIRVPFIVSWKGRIAPGQTDSRPIIQLDVHPTALAAAGVAVKPEWRLDGVNLLPFLTGRAGGRPHETLYWRLGTTMAIRSGNWKLVKMSDGGFMQDPAQLTLDGAELFDLSSDIGETKNLAPAQPDRVRMLGDTWQKWASQLSAPKWPAPINPGQGVPPR
ncbi:MAG: sulfatase [Gemmatimonadaceae bacterium]